MISHVIPQVVRSFTVTEVQFNLCGYKSNKFTKCWFENHYHFAPLCYCRCRPLYALRHVKVSARDKCSPGIADPVPQEEPAVPAVLLQDVRRRWRPAGNMAAHGRWHWGRPQSEKSAHHHR